MRERINANGAGGTADARGCGREEELMAYLYGESAPAEAADFRRHLADCAACGEELAAFGGVRAIVGEWREEVMRSIPALNVAERVARVAPVASETSAMKTETHAPEVTHFATRARTRLASAALREFFSLAPLWLRVGTATAAVVFCALAALTLARAEVRWDSNGLAFNTGVRERVVEKLIPFPSPAPEGFTQEQVDALIRQNVEREVAAAQDRWRAEDAERAKVVNAGGVRRASPPHNARGASEAKSRQSPRRSTRGGSNDRLLAEDNGDVFYPDEESVPRLTDILGAVKTPVKNER
ncbi:MAG TPA: zf-HC2 domain-containing protein [Pyrinomonadaceae bacterium]|nr:zf-HC2 domain-containing protein [Pyrinomonadaceae bacterium]